MSAHYAGIEGQFESKRFCAKAEGTQALVHLLADPKFTWWLEDEEVLIAKRKGLTTPGHPG